MPPHFVGRDEIAQELVEQLTGGASLALSAQGLPGVGKTTLAVALAHHEELKEHFKDGVLWASLGPKAKKEDVVGILTRWADALGIDVADIADVAERKQAVEDAISQRSLLIVIDDVWNIDLARQLRFGNPNCCHLLTTRDLNIARQFAGAGQSLSVATLEENPSLQLLQELAPEACAADPAAAQALAQVVGGLPLALELLGGYLAIPEHSLFPALSQVALTEMMDPRRRLQLAQERLGAPGQQVTLQDTIALSIEGLRELEKGEELKRAFYSLGAFAPKPEQFGLEAAEAVTGVEKKALALLVARNLVETTSEQLALHQVLANVAETKVDEVSVIRHRDYYLSLVQEDWEDWQRIEGAYGQIKWAWESAAEDEELLELVWALSLYQKRRGLWQDHLAWNFRGLELAREHKWQEAEGILLNNIGTVYNRLGQREKALEYYTRALSIREEVGDRAGQAITLSNIGFLYKNMGHPEKALEYYTRALPIREEVGDRAGLATTLNNIGSRYDDLGHPEKALEYYTRALPIREEVGDRAGLATTLNNIGFLYNSMGHPEKALEYYTRALPIREEVGDRYGRAKTLYNVAMVYRAQGRLEEAVALLKQVVELDRLVQHPDLEDEMAMLAQVESELAAKQEEQ